MKAATPQGMVVPTVRWPCSIYTHTVITHAHAHPKSKATDNQSPSLTQVQQRCTRREPMHALDCAGMLSCHMPAQPRPISDGREHLSCRLSYTPALSGLLHTSTLRPFECSKRHRLQSICEVGKARVDQLGEAVVLAHAHTDGHVVQGIQEQAIAVCQGAVSTVLGAAAVS